MIKPARAAIAAAIMSRGLPGRAIRVIFTEVSFLVASARTDARLCGYKAVTIADRSAR
jgi:hypothetical protein